MLNMDRKSRIVSVLFLAVMLLLLFFFGVNLQGEASKFLNEANAINSGTPFPNGSFSFFYFFYSLLTAVFLKLGLSFIFFGAFQIGMSWIAALCLRKLILQMSADDRLAFVAFLLYLFCYPIQKWNFFLYSEGLHTSFVVIGVYAFYKLLLKPGFPSAIFFAFILFLIITTRPVGVLFLMAAFLTFNYILFIRKQKRAALLCAAGGIAVLIILLNSPVRYFINPDSLRRMEIICQVPQQNSDVTYTQYNRAGLKQAYVVVKNEIGFGRFFHAGFMKLRSFFGLVRPYYSLKNNVLLGWYLLLYPLACIGFSRIRRTPVSSLLFFSLVYILTTAAGIFVTCDDWSDRFIAPVMPFIIIPGALGITHLYRLRFRNVPRL